MLLKIQCGQPLVYYVDEEKITTWIITSKTRYQLQNKTLRRSYYFLSACHDTMLIVISPLSN